MKLKVGMWVITNDRMKVGQIKDFCTCEKCEKRGFYEPITTNHIYITDYDKAQGFHGYKFYENVLELVQPGDYVNGVLVESIYERTDEHLLFHTFDEEFMFEITKDNIEDIVTKEQFNSMKYVVESDNQ